MGGRRLVEVFFFGDSICFGQGVSPHLTWVAMLGRALHEHFEGRLDLIIQNPSVNGNTTRMALERMPHDVQAHSPQVLFAQFGMNDCNVWETDKGHPRVSQDAFAANLSEIVDRARQIGVDQIILGTNHPTTRFGRLPHVEYSYEHANRSYNSITRTVAERKGTELADAEAVCDQLVKSGKLLLSELVLNDELHLSQIGHQIYFESRLPIVVEAVERVAALDG